ncbi:hypothetical protein JTB14_002935 [Gonioctena quinquepunctata]|nr:hypothetical protein JTB14_002935 [Gonioctena quinquepunctata]
MIERKKLRKLETLRKNFRENIDDKDENRQEKEKALNSIGARISDVNMEVIKNTEKFQEYSEVTATLLYTQQEYNLLLDDIKREVRRKARIAGEKMKEQHKEKKDGGIPYDVVAQASQEALSEHWMKQLPEKNKKK